MGIKQFLLYVRVFRWRDGDTFYGILDHGRHLYYGSEIDLPRFRCARIDAPELGTPEADAATEYARKIAPPGEYQCWSTKLDEYGRPLIDLIVSGGLFSDLMLAAGHAKIYKAATPQAVDNAVDSSDPYGYLYRPRSTGYSSSRLTYGAPDDTIETAPVIEDD
jgi:endonuclease YncB( thermonuclease family)